MKAQVRVNKNFTIGKTDDRIYGSMIEHIGRDVYGGLYDPNHKTADDMGFRSDVIDMVRKMEIAGIRYPGGNFVSQYNWEDGTGDKSKRPTKVEIAFQAIEPNEVGIDEFQEWAKRVNSSVMLSVNLGTRGADEARNLVEYCNLETDTYYANMRKGNGFEKPFNIKTWFLGNEMGGSSQLFQKTADEYGRLAKATARAMKNVDPDIELVVCGCSSRGQKTFGNWGLTVLEYTYPFVDHYSIHFYCNNNSNNTPKFLGKSLELDEFIKSACAICDVIKAKCRTDKTMTISVDEWNVFGMSMETPKEGMWKTGYPRLEQVYTFEDALVVGCLMMTIQNNCDRVKIACFNTLINSLAPIMTETGGSVWAQTIFYPFLYASKNGRGTVLKPVVECEKYSIEDINDIPYLETSVVYDEEKGEVNVFAVNRSLDEDIELDMIIENFGECELKEHIELYADDLYVKNSAKEEAVTPKNVDLKEKIVLKKHSWNMLRFSY